MSQHVIPRVNVSDLFSEDGSARSVVDRAIQSAAKASGMMAVTGLPQWAALDRPSRRELLRIFSLPERDAPSP